MRLHVVSLLGYAEAHRLVLALPPAAGRKPPARAAPLPCPTALPFAYELLKALCAITRQALCCSEDPELAVLAAETALVCASVELECAEVRPALCPLAQHLLSSTPHSSQLSRHTPSAQLGDCGPPHAQHTPLMQAASQAELDDCGLQEQERGQVVPQLMNVVVSAAEAAALSAVKPKPQR